MKWILISMLGIVVLAACEGNVYSLKVGDCYNGVTIDKYSGETMEVRDVELVSCDEPHESEVYAISDLPDSDWKGGDYVYEQARIFCLDSFEPFVGVEYALSTLDADFIYPTEESWKDMGDRLVQCSIYQESYMKVSGSLRGSRR
ncbi:MAG: septum formation family protein [Chloroflexi bacterium]|nr:septum formation family protein [Chloroflexota bacterium]